MALDGIDLSLEQGGFLAVVGPSGCGKSTLLQIAAGLMRADRGTVKLSGEPVTSPPPHVVYVFQQYSKSLFPWRTVLANVDIVRCPAAPGLGVTLAERAERSMSIAAEAG
jgi:NitT/TauT family transport system ATP-binding protein